jgi:hypothetical protein
MSEPVFIDHTGPGGEVWLSVRDKRLTVKQFRFLLRNDLTPQSWERSGRVYHFMQMYCGFIAHYNQPGFYSAQLSTPQRAISFLDKAKRELESLAEHPPPAYDTLRDVAEAMLAELEPEYTRLITMLVEAERGRLIAVRESAEADLLAIDRIINRAK